MLDENDISKLLRLKRYEQPPPGYFDDFLREFQTRQRNQLLKQPLWRIALERVGAFFSDHTTGRLAYGSAAIAVLVLAGFSTVGTLKHSGTHSQSKYASAKVASHTYQVPVYEGSEGARVAQSGRVPMELAGYHRSAGARTHYVMDARPVSYERPSF